MQADLHAGRFPYVLIICSLPVVFVCNALFLFLLQSFHMYKGSLGRCQLEHFDIATCRPLQPREGRQRRGQKRRRGAAGRSQHKSKLKTTHPTMPYLQWCARRESHPGAPPGGLDCLLSCLLEFVIIRVALASLATGATRGFSHSIPL